MHEKKLPKICTTAILLSLFNFVGIFFYFPAVAGEILPNRINQIIIQGHFKEQKPAFLVIFSSTPEHDKQSTLAAMTVTTANKAPVAKQTVAIKLYGKPASKPGRFDYFFGTLYDGDRPWNNGIDFDWQDWKNLSPDIWDNVSIIYLPQGINAGKKSIGVISNVTIRMNGMLLYDSRIRQSYANKKPMDASFKAVDLSSQNPLLNLTEHIKQFRNEYYELGDHSILRSAYADLGQTEKHKYTSRGKNWCSEFAAYLYRENGYPAPDPNEGDVYWKNMRLFFERYGSVYTLREVSAWPDTDKIAKIKPGTFVSILNGKSTHSLLFTTWITQGKSSITQFTGISGNNKGMVWSHAPLSLPAIHQFRNMTPAQLAAYDQKAFFGVISDEKKQPSLPVFPEALSGKPLRGLQ